MDIYNDAWEGKWGMVPALADETEKVGRGKTLPRSTWASKSMGAYVYKKYRVYKRAL